MHGPVFHLLGLSQRAGKVAAGDFAVRQQLARGKVKLLIVAANTSERIKQDYVQMGRSKNVPVVLALTKEALGCALGKSPRAAVAVLDENFARGIQGLLEKGEK
ncbi:L7Ae/L30e/S12e/Gadd45 family ribosomal protein [Desulforamulus hydrothermalis]|uniref:LSU ribosomal protein L7AE n=1 Tax=Desulforamulus hydrothermalis Lam5 = DSM 18033 TaxID=1121428 RepID=K8E194_9FIRM|nr:ribosomal L7Ae/L30e/S12e/Gadd45 family protein [Desulforamulus hydrothermalis]CCO09425.1 LSU ribosomal protein L7AE [Desulforamulus hydrothermalis Lam5 = DSM 18033]SHH08440.1 Ribosomal protein L7Ae [Desulforamulus hydrothermalis Lam5 = DSM 18033]